MTRFVIATLLPAALLFLAAFWGGFWVWSALGCVTLVVLALDQLPIPGPKTARDGHILLTGLGVLHFPALLVAVLSVAGQTGLGFGERLGLLLGFGIYIGQVSVPAAHELIHAQKRALFKLGRAIYISVLFGHHTSAHLLVHHPHVATARDPNSAKIGRSAYRFLADAWIGSFRAGLAAERARAKRSTKGKGTPYPLYVLGAVTALLVSWSLAGAPGLISHLVLAFHVQAQLLLTDYVQHYGLRRPEVAPGRYAPQTPAHSWNAPHWYSSAMLLNAPRHSDHHLTPQRPYPQLRLTEDMPTLPAPLPLMATLALAPRLWRRVMDPRVQRWMERSYQTSEEIE